MVRPGSVAAFVNPDFGVRFFGQPPISALGRRPFASLTFPLTVSFIPAVTSLSGRGGNRYVQPTAAAPHSDSTISAQTRRLVLRCSQMIHLISRGPKQPTVSALSALNHLFDPEH